MRSSSRLHHLGALLCISLLVGACSDGQSASASAGTPQASSQISEGSNLVMVTIAAEDSGSEARPVCLFQFTAENRSKEKLTPVLEFKALHAQSGQAIADAEKTLGAVVFGSLAPGKTSFVEYKEVNGASCVDIKLKFSKNLCMDGCTYQWKTEGFAGMS